MHVLLNGFEIVALFSVFSSAFTSPSTCIHNRTADGSVVCCANYYKDKNEECNSCAPGYFGDTCEKTCPPGTFGDLCGGKCSPNCSEEECDPVNGCPDVNQNGTPVTFPDLTSFITIPRQQLTNKSSSTSSTSSPFTSFNKPSTNLSTKSTQMTTISIITGSTDKNDNFNILYLLVGVGALIALFLFVIIVQLCLRSRTAQRRISKRKSGDYSDIKEPANPLVKSRQSDRKKYNELRHYRNRENFYQHIESDYQEIDHCLEMVNEPSKENRRFGSKELKDSPSSNDSYLSPVAEKEQIDNSGNDAYVEPVEQKSCIETEHALSDVEPFNKQRKEKNCNKGGRHSYIEILESGDIQTDQTLSDENCDDGSKSSSSYDDVIGQSSTVSRNMSAGKDNTYLDVVT